MNFVTAHDGFTLHDLVSYNEKHNKENLEGNQDGEDHNRSWNCGEEGPSEDPAVLECRAKQRRNFLATLFLSQGVPMLLGGDEIGRTQSGNNNAYCQDNEISWFDWESADRELENFVRALVDFRLRHPVLHRRRWFQGRPIRGVEEIAWLRPDAQEMTDEDWQTGFAQAVGVFLNGEALTLPDLRGRRLVDDSFLLFFNAAGEALEWTLPEERFGRRWAVALDTVVGFVEGRAKRPAVGPLPEPRCLTAGQVHTLPARSVLALRRVEPGRPGPSAG